MSKLTEDDREVIRDIIESEQWEVVLKAAAIAVDDQKTRLLNIPLADGKDEIFNRKAKLEGGKEILSFLEKLKSELRRKK